MPYTGIYEFDSIYGSPKLHSHTFSLGVNRRGQERSYTVQNAIFMVNMDTFLHDIIKN